MEKTPVERAITSYNRLKENILRVIRGKDEMITMLLAAFFCGGHVLLEDKPGTGKTTLAKVLARSVGTGTTRVQFTPDLLPADIIGVNVYNRQTGSFVFHKGPLFTNILLADEINRASPRAQSALLEAMGEKQVSVEGERYLLDKLFFVIATENPVESHGTYPLPESQLDRFMVKLSPGYLSRDEEAAVLADQLVEHPLAGIQSVIGEEDVFQVMEALLTVRISEELRYYIVDLVARTRNSTNIEEGAGVRASLALMKISQALALFDSRDFVIPEDIHRAFLSVVGHRLQLLQRAKFTGIEIAAVLDEIMAEVPVPS